MENHIYGAVLPMSAYEGLEEEIKHLRLRIKELESKLHPFKFKVNGEELEFILERSYAGNLVIVCQGNYLAGINPEGRLIRYVLCTDTFPLNKRKQIKVDKDTI